MVARGSAWEKDVTTKRLHKQVLGDTIVLLIVELHKSTGVKIDRAVQTKKSQFYYMII